MDWIKADAHLQELIDIYKKLPYQSAWFAMGQLNTLRHRFDTGERTQKLYDEIMAME